MHNRWIASVALLCPAHHRTAAAQTAAALSGNPADATPDFFSRAIGPPDSAPTHYLAHPRIRAAALAALPQLEAQYPGAAWIITAHDDDSPEQAAQRPTVDAWLASLGLTYQDTEDDTP